MVRAWTAPKFQPWIEERWDGGGNGSGRWVPRNPQMIEDQRAAILLAAGPNGPKHKRKRRSHAPTRLEPEEEQEVGCRACAFGLGPGSLALQTAARR